MPEKPILWVQGGAHKTAQNSGFLTRLNEQGLDMDQFEYGKAISAGGMTLAMFHSDQPRDRVLAHWVEDHAYGELIHWSRLLRGNPPFDRATLHQRVVDRFGYEAFKEEKPPIYMGVTRIDGSYDYIRATRQNIFDTLHATSSLPALVGPHPIGPPAQIPEALAPYTPEQQALAWDGGLANMLPSEEIAACCQDPSRILIMINTRALDEIPKFHPVLHLRRNFARAFKRCIKNYTRDIEIALQQENIHIFAPAKPIPGKMMDTPEVVRQRFEAGEYLADGPQGDRLMEIMHRPVLPL